MELGGQWQCPVLGTHLSLLHLSLKGVTTPPGNSPKVPPRPPPPTAPPTQLGWASLGRKKEMKLRGGPAGSQAPTPTGAPPPHVVSLAWPRSLTGLSLGERPRTRKRAVPGDRRCLSAPRAGRTCPVNNPARWHAQGAWRVPDKTPVQDQEPRPSRGPVGPASHPQRLRAGPGGAQPQPRRQVEGRATVFPPELLRFSFLCLCSAFFPKDFRRPSTPPERGRRRG